MPTPGSESLASLLFADRQCQIVFTFYQACRLTDMLSYTVVWTTATLC